MVASCAGPALAAPLAAAAATGLRHSVASAASTAASSRSASTGPGCGALALGLTGGCTSAEGSGCCVGAVLGFTPAAAAAAVFFAVAGAEANCWRAQRALARALCGRRLGFSWHTAEPCSKRPRAFGRCWSLTLPDWQRGLGCLQRPLLRLLCWWRSWRQRRVDWLHRPGPCDSLALGLALEGLSCCCRLGISAGRVSCCWRRAL